MSTPCKPTSITVWHWRWQRITAVAMIFLSVWFVVMLVSQLLNADPAALAKWLSDPLIATTMAALILAAQIHKHIGLHEIITDYVHCGIKKRLSSLLLNAACALVTLATLGAIWHLYLVGNA